MTKMISWFLLLATVSLAACAEKPAATTGAEATLLREWPAGDDTQELWGVDAWRLLSDPGTGTQELVGVNASGRALTGVSLVSGDLQPAPDSGDHELALALSEDLTMAQSIDKAAVRSASASDADAGAEPAIKIEFVTCPPGCKSFLFGAPCILCIKSIEW
jgi:hypothetical protein